MRSTAVLVREDEDDHPVEILLAVSKSIGMRNEQTASLRLHNRMRPELLLLVLRHVHPPSAQARAHQTSTKSTPIRLLHLVQNPRIVRGVVVVALGREVWHFPTGGCAYPDAPFSGARLQRPAKIASGGRLSVRKMYE